MYKVGKWCVNTTGYGENVKKGVMIIYEFLIYASRDCSRPDKQHMIQEIVMKYAGEKNCDCSEHLAGREVVYRVANETVTVFNNGVQYVLTSDEDFKDGNGLLDNVIEGCLKENHWIKLVHLSGVLLKN
ncbi:hypothetical protein ACJROX_19060 [Pseudalkalibacillus sp. A8]|uniref:hypothetical protein n=1 Tax=Pseudalkalibacillus sp. A8 TaxID=3382641 RepID=UPI0038B5746A